MQAYVVIMILLVVGGTLFDIIHKGSARYFFANWRKSQRQRRQSKSVAANWCRSPSRPAVVDVLASGEFCNPRRRLAHLLTMYGFIIYVVTTAVMVFGYPTPATPAPGIVPLLWWIGGLMVCLGGYWFWFFIRVDVAAEGDSPLRVMRADLFVLSLLASVTLGLIWAWLQASGSSGRQRRSSACTSSPRRCCSAGCLVQVRAHVLQARGGLRETSLQGQWHGRESAHADPGRSRTTGKTLDGTVAGCPDGHGAWHQARSTAPLLENSP